MQFIKSEMCQNIELLLQKCCMPLRGCYAENAINRFALLQLEKKIKNATWKLSFSEDLTSEAWHSHMGSRVFFCFGFFFFIPSGDHSSQKILSTSYTEMTDNLTHSEQENVLKVSSGRSKKSSSWSQGTDQHTTCSILQAIHVFLSSFVPHY